jgi:hypothetical protein
MRDIRTFIAVGLAPVGSPDAAVASAARTVLVTLIGQLPSELTPPSCITAGQANAESAAARASSEGAVAEVLKQFFGTDRISFRDCGTTLPAGSTCGDPSPVLRSYSTFSQPADENAYSRILIGFHFRKSVEEGIEFGRDIARRAANLYFRVVH